MRVFATSTAPAAGYNGGIELTKTWGGTVAFEHYWTPSLRTSWVAGYLEVEYSDTAKALMANRGRRCCAERLVYGTVWTA